MVIKMNENENRTAGAMTYEERERRRNGSADFSLPQRNGFLVKTVTAQFTVVAILIAAAFFMRSANTEAFDYFRGKFNSLMKRDITFEEMASAFKSVGAFAVGGTENAGEETSEDETEDETGEETQKETGENPDKAETEKPESTVPDASGGEDLLKAQDKTTFSPIVISEKPISPLENYTVTSRFGYRDNPISGKYGFHTGLDMAAEKGTPVKAAYSGVVSETGFTQIRGNYLVIEHSDNTETVYYHCEKILCEIDDFVRQGQTVALVGSTGWSTGSHLHFEVRINGVSCNPEYLLDGLKDK